MAETPVNETTSMDSPARPPIGRYIPKWGKQENSDLAWRVSANVLGIALTIMADYLIVRLMVDPLEASYAQIQHAAFTLGLIIGVIVFPLFAIIGVADWRRRQVARVLYECSKIEYPLAGLSLGSESQITFNDCSGNEETVRYPRLQMQVTEGAYYIEPGPEVCVTSRARYEQARASLVAVST
jgi:hypothetical protein